MKNYTYVPKAGAYAFCKQESIVFQALQDVGSGSIEEIAERCRELGLKTRQTNERIVAYYMVSLKKLGLVSITGQNAGGRRVTIVIGDEGGMDDVQGEETSSDETKEETTV